MRSEVLWNTIDCSFYLSVSLSSCFVGCRKLVWYYNLETFFCRKLFYQLQFWMASSTLISDTQPWKDLKVWQEQYFLNMHDAKIVKIYSMLLLLQDHVEDIKKTHLRDLLSNEERSKSMMVYVTYFMKRYSLAIWYFILQYDVITWILHSLKWIWWNSIGLLKAAGHPWNNGKTLQIGRGQFSHFRCSS